MGKVPVRLKEVVYTLSPFEQSVMSGLWKDMPHKTAHYMAKVKWQCQDQNKMARLVDPTRVKNSRLSTFAFQAREIGTWFILPLSGVMWYCSDYKEKEKQEHRF